MMYIFGFQEAPSVCNSLGAIWPLIERGREVRRDRSGERERKGQQERQRQRDREKLYFSIFFFEN